MKEERYKGEYAEALENGIVEWNGDWCWANVRVADSVRVSESVEKTALNRKEGDKGRMEKWKIVVK